MNDDSLDHSKTDRATGERYAGDHLLVEFWGAERLMEPEYICAAMEDGARVKTHRISAQVLFGAGYPAGQDHGAGICPPV